MKKLLFAIFIVNMAQTPIQANGFGKIINYIKNKFSTKKKSPKSTPKFVLPIRQRPPTAWEQYK